MRIGIFYRRDAENSLFYVFLRRLRDEHFLLSRENFYVLIPPDCREINAADNHHPDQKYGQPTDAVRLIFLVLRYVFRVLQIRQFLVAILQIWINARHRVIRVALHPLRPHFRHFRLKLAQTLLLETAFIH